MAKLANVEVLREIQINKAEYLKSSKIIFECFDSFSQKAEKMGKFKIDEWAQIQTADGNNAITNLLFWTVNIAINVSFPIVNNFVY